MKRQRRRRTQQELLLDSYRSGREETTAGPDPNEEGSRISVRTRKVQGVRIALLDDTEEEEEEAPPSGDSRRDEPTVPPKTNPYANVKVSEPVECFESFVVMDRLRAPRNKHIVFLDGYVKTRTGFHLFEASEDDMFFNLKQGRVNRSAKLKFRNSPKPLRPLNDPNRGQLVAKMAKDGIPTEPTRWEKLREPPVAQTSYNAPNPNPLRKTDPSASRSETIDVDPSIVKIEPMDVF